jgi:hypothetical protein
MSGYDSRAPTASQRTKGKACKDGGDGHNQPRNGEFSPDEAPSRKRRGRGTKVSAKGGQQPQRNASGGARDRALRTPCEGGQENRYEGNTSKGERDGVRI